MDGEGDVSPIFAMLKKYPQNAEICPYKTLSEALTELNSAPLHLFEAHYVFLRYIISPFSIDILL